MAAGPQKRPQRTCVACRRASDKGGFVRFVRLPDGSVALDPSGRAPGRGAYLCSSMGCFEEAHRRHRLDAALKTKVGEDAYAALESEFKAEIARADAQ